MCLERGRKQRCVGTVPGSARDSCEATGAGLMEVQAAIRAAGAMRRSGLGFDREHGAGTVT